MSPGVGAGGMRRRPSGGVGGGRPSGGAYGASSLTPGGPRIGGPGLGGGGGAAGLRSPSAYLNRTPGGGGAGAGEAGVGSWGAAAAPAAAAPGSGAPEDLVAAALAHSAVAGAAAAMDAVAHRLGLFVERAAALAEERLSTPVRLLTVCLVCSCPKGTCGSGAPDQPCMPSRHAACQAMLPDPHCHTLIHCPPHALSQTMEAAAAAASRQLDEDLDLDGPAMRPPVLRRSMQTITGGGGGTAAATSALAGHGAGGLSMMTQGIAGTGAMTLAGGGAGGGGLGGAGLSSSDPLAAAQRVCCVLLSSLAPAHGPEAVRCAVQAWELAWGRPGAVGLEVLEALVVCAAEAAARWVVISAAPVGCNQSHASVLYVLHWD